MARLRTLFTLVAGLALLAMMLLTFADVIGRKFFEHSLTGAVEMTELMMLAMIFFGLPVASMAGEHIVFDLLDRVLPAALLRWQQRLAQLLTALVLGGGAWVVWEKARRTAEYGDHSATLEIPIAPFHTLVALMLALTALVHLVLAWRGEPPPPHDAAALDAPAPTQAPANAQEHA